MINIDKYEGHDLAKGRVGSDYNIYDRKGNIILDAVDVGNNMATLNLIADAPLLLKEVKQLREESKKKGDVLTTLDEMIRNEASHIELMKALEQGLDLPETWKEMVE